MTMVVWHILLSAYKKNWMFFRLAIPASTQTLKSIQLVVSYLQGLTVKQESYSLATDVEATYTMQDRVIYNKHGNHIINISS